MNNRDPLELLVIENFNHKHIQYRICQACKYCACLGLLLLLTGCGDIQTDFGLADLDSPEPIVRVMAIKWAGDNKVSAAVPRLVDFLEDEDNSVRFYAIGALKRITGDDNGYDYKSSWHDRARAVKRWRAQIDPNDLTDMDESSNAEN